jgi:hypothetical protein
MICGTNQKPKEMDKNARGILSTDESMTLS